MSTKTVTVSIDGQQITVPAGTTAVDAAAKVGVEIPIFCHHPRLEPVGMCRMCLVEVGTPKVDRATGQAELDVEGRPVIGFMPKLQAGCTTRCTEGMAIRTQTPVVSEARESVLEFLLTSHPLDCPVCDKGGECPLQNLTMRYGPGQSRFQWGEKFHFKKPVPIGPLIALDRERCVLCARCIRFEDEIAGDQVLGFESRGRGMEIVAFGEEPFKSYFSGNTTDICPVGALTTKDFRFEARAWELVGHAGVCGHCSVGCNLMHDVRFGRIERVMPRQNEAVNEIWLCDKGRFGHAFAQDGTRLQTPLVRKDGELVEASWDEALTLVAERLMAVQREQGPMAVGGIAGSGLANEELYLFGKLLRGVLGTNNVDHRGGILRDDVIARCGAGADLRLTELGAGDCLLVAGLDVEEEAPVLFLNLLKAVGRGAKVVVLSGRPQKLDAHADLVLRYALGGEDDVVAALARALASLPTAQAASDPVTSTTPATPAATAPLAASDDSDVTAAVETAAPDPAVARRSALAEALAAFSADSLAGRHPLRAEDLDAAAALLGGAARLLMLFGQEAADSGWAPGLAALLAAGPQAADSGSGLVAVGRHANSQGAADMGLLPDWLPGYRPVSDPAAHADLAPFWPHAVPDAPGLDAPAMLAGGVKALYLMGTDPAGDDPRLESGLEAMDFLVVQDLYLTESAKRAHVVLPAMSAPEREGTTTNMTRRVQRFYAAVDRMGRSRADWKILRDVCQRLGHAAPYATAADLFAEIAQAVPAYAGLSYAQLGPPSPPEPEATLLPFAPQTEARKVSYQGTAYVADLGEGRVWPAANDLDSASRWRPRAVAASNVAATNAAAPARLRLQPVPTLYDGGARIRAASILHPLVRLPYVQLSPFDSTALGLAAGSRVRLSAPAGAVTAEVEIRDGLTPGMVLAPEGLAWERPLASLLDGAPTVMVAVERVA
ncbi:MAG: NADH-quinone oxidoreductase subunit NuoG [Anaerolineae bacterium]